MKVLGISGKKGAGKDTLAGKIIAAQSVIFPHKTVVRVGLADPIKEMVILGFGAAREDVYGDDNAKNKPLPHGNEGICIRDALKRVGQVFAELETNHWVRYFTTMCEMHALHTTREVVVLCTDVRFPKEVHAVHDLGGKVIRLTRQPLPHDPHPSETALDGFMDFDVFIKDMPIEDTFLYTAKLMQHWGWC